MHGYGGNRPNSHAGTLVHAHNHTNMRKHKYTPSLSHKHAHTHSTVPSGSTVSWVALLKVLLVLMSMVMVEKQKYFPESAGTELAR